MKVSDAMSHNVEFVTTRAPISEVCYLIFGRGINGVPVCKDRKVVGFITERDILEKFYPSMQEYMEDPVHASDFESMEKKVSEIFSLSADKVMSEDPTTVTPDTPLLKAQSMMFVKKIGRMPVVDEHNYLVGIISKSDIFRSIVGRGLPHEGEEGFYDWFASYYDTDIDWKERLGNEIPDLVSAFRKEKVAKVLDVASSTGEHLIALAKKGFVGVGIESSGLMHKQAEAKKGKLGANLKQKLTFQKGHYGDLLPALPADFDAATFMGNALSHVIYTQRTILSDVARVLKPHAVMIFQITNYDKLLRQNGLRDFSIRTSYYQYKHEHAFLRFYTRGKGSKLDYNLAVFDRKGDKWNFRGLHTTEAMYIEKTEITKMLKKIGFSQITYSGGRLDDSLFDSEFNPKESDWLNVIAKR